MTRFHIRQRLANGLHNLVQRLAPTSDLEPETKKIQREHEELGAKIKAEEQAENKPAPMVSEPEPQPKPTPLTEEELLEERMDRFMGEACALLDHDNQFIDLDGPFRLWSLIINLGSEDQRLQAMLTEDHMALIKLAQKGRKAFLGSCPSWIKKKIQITENNLLAQLKQGRKGAFEIVCLVQEHIVNNSDPACQLAFSSRAKCMKALGWAEAQLEETKHVKFTAFVDRNSSSSYCEGLSEMMRQQEMQSQEALWEVVNTCHKDMRFNFFGDPNPGNNPVREQKKQLYLKRTTSRERALNALRIYDDMIRNSLLNQNGQLEELVETHDTFVELLDQLDKAVTLSKPAGKKPKKETVEFKVLPTPEEEAALKKARRETQMKAKQAKRQKKIESKLKKIYNAIKSKSGLGMAQERYKQLRNDHAEQFPLEWDAFKAAYEQQLAEERKKAAAAAQAAARRNRKGRSAS